MQTYTGTSTVREYIYTGIHKDTRVHALVHMIAAPMRVRVPSATEHVAECYLQAPNVYINKTAATHTAAESVSAIFGN